MHGQNSMTRFDVFFKGSNIGSVVAINVNNAGTTVRDVKTRTNVKVLLTSIRMESELKVIYENGIMKNGTAYRKANQGNEDMETTTTRIRSKTYTIETFNQKSKLENTEIKFCVADLYFSEPTHIRKVFSNMYGVFLEIEKVGASTYLINLPDGRKTYFLYEKGQIDSIEVEMGFGKIITKRKV